MKTDMPRIASVGVIDAGADNPTSRILTIGWRGERAVFSEVDLSGWIATGGPVLASLAEFELFRTAGPSEFGDAVEWGEPGGDLAIDAVHLEMLAHQQQPMHAHDLAAWQDWAGISNTEAADFFDIGRSTWIAYKDGVTTIPVRVQMICRAALRDPIILQAHLRPAPKAGRPKKAVAPLQ